MLATHWAKNKVCWSFTYLPTLYTLPPYSKNILHSREEIILLLSAAEMSISFQFLSNKLDSSMDLQVHQSWPQGFKTNFILLINVKMPLIVGILTFISMINATSERVKASNFLICQYLVFMSS